MQCALNANIFLMLYEKFMSKTGISMAGARPKQCNVLKDKCWKAYLSSLREKTCAEDKLRDMKKYILIIENHFYCTRRKVEKIETQHVKVEL